MRITNMMMQSNMLSNINRNMRNVDKLFNQYTTTKKIQVPSDNPILATRVLKFQTSISQTLQYKENVSQAVSWMEISESSIGSVLDALKIIFEKCEEGASDQFDFSDRQVLTKQIEELIGEIGYLMNQTYSGRYVFSGYRTNSEEPPVFLEGNERSFTISQSFSLKDIEQTKSYQKILSTTGLNDDPSTVKDVNIIKLAYKGTSAPEIYDSNGKLIASADTTLATPPKYAIVSKSLSDPDAYVPPDGNTIHFIKETGELVVPNDFLSESALKDGINVMYDKTGFEAGELNPKVYFSCEDKTVSSYTEVKKAIYSQAVDFVYSVSEEIDMPSVKLNASDANAVAGKAGAYQLDFKWPLDRYDNYDLSTLNVKLPDGYTVIEMTQAEADARPAPASGEIYYIKGTGSFIVGQDFIDNNEAIEASYPYNVVKLAYENGITNLKLPDPYTMNDVAVMNSSDPNAYAPDDNGKAIHFLQDTGELVFTDTVKSFIGTSGSISITYDKYGFKANDLNPAYKDPITDKYQGTITGATAISINPPFEFNMDSQKIEYEFSTGIRMAVNSLAKDIYTDKMYADLQSLLDIVNRMELTPESALVEKYKALGYEGDELDKKVKEQQTVEMNQLKGVLQNKFSNLVKSINGEHLERITAEHTSLGTRMQRLDLIQSRLELEYDSYVKLESDANGANMVDVITQYNNAMSVYNASLQASAKIVQMTLANYL